MSTQPDAWFTNDCQLLEFVSRVNRRRAPSDRFAIRAGDDKRKNSVLAATPLQV
jgi:hypothetical protein